MNNPKITSLALSQGWWKFILVTFGSYYYFLSPDTLVTWQSSTDLLLSALLDGNYAVPQTAWLIRLYSFLLGSAHHFTFASLRLLTAFLAGLTLALFYQMLAKFTFGETRETSLSFLFKNLWVTLLAVNADFVYHGLFIERYIPMLLLAFGLWLVPKNHLTLSFVFLVLGLCLSPLFIVLGAMHLLDIGTLRFKQTSVVSFCLAFLTASLLAAFVLTKLSIVSNPGDYSFLLPHSLVDLFTTHQQTYLYDGFRLSMTGFPNDIQQWVTRISERVLSAYNPWFLGFALLSLTWLIRVKRRAAIALLLPLVYLIVLRVLPSETVGQAQSFFETSSVLLLTLLLLASFPLALHFASRLMSGLASLHSLRSVDYSFRFVIGGILTWLMFAGVHANKILLEPEELHRRMLAELPPKAILICFQDVTCSDLIYLSQVELVRPDVTVIPYYYDPQTYSLEIDTLRPFGYTQKPYILHEIVSVALADEENRAVYATGITQDQYLFLGFDLGTIYYLPRGNYGQLSLYISSDISQDALLGENETNLFANVPDLLDDYALLLLQNRFLSATTYFQLGLYDAGYRQMNASSILAKNLPDRLFDQFLTNRNNVEQLTKSSLFKPLSPLSKVPLLLKEIPLYIQAGYYGRASAFLRSALLIDPFNSDLRRKAVDFYTAMGMLDMAAVEEQNAFRLETSLQR